MEQNCRCKILLLRIGLADPESKLVLNTVQPAADALSSTQDCILL